MPLGPNPTIPEGQNLPEYLAAELQRLWTEVDLLQSGRGFPLLSVAPLKPRDGQLVNADGVGWNPGSGAGYYERKGGAWVKL